MRPIILKRTAGRVDPQRDMTTCPRCSFLMGDDETVCAACRTQPDRSFPIDELTTDLPASGAAPRAGSTLLLDPRALSDPATEVRYRDPATGHTLRTAVIALVLLGGLGALGWASVQGHGPLASTAVSLGLADPPGVVVPDRWTTLSSDEGHFRSLLPAGAEAHERPVDESEEALGSLVGFRTDLGEDAEMYAVSGSLGLGAEQLRSLDDPAFDLVVDELIVRLGLGEETVRREGIVASGRAVDSVLVDGDEVTTRARFLLDAGRVHLMVTSGSEEGARALNEAHARLIAEYRATP